VWFGQNLATLYPDELAKRFYINIGTDQLGGHGRPRIYSLAIRDHLPSQKSLNVPVLIHSSVG
jgi:hypothetical protein